MSICVGQSCQLTLGDLQAGTQADLSDLQIDESSHPNVMPFNGTLLLLDEASNQAPHGANGHQILVPTEVARKRLNTLPGMAINYQSDLTGHNPSKKVGVITHASIEGKKVRVKGFVWKKDFPDAEKTFKSNRGRLGMSMELGDVYVTDQDAHVWELEDFHFTGATVLLKDHAAYEKTDLAASRHFVKALAAAADARGIFRKGGKPEMADKDNNKKKDSGQSQAQALVASISAAVGTGMESGMSKFLASQEDTNKKLFTVLEGISASQEELVKGLQTMAIGDVDAGAEDDSQDDTRVDDVDAGADPTMAADATDATATNDPSEDPTEMDAEGDPTNFTSADQGDDAEPGNLNKDANSLAKSKSKSGSTQMKPGGKSISKGIAAGKGGSVGAISAAAKVIRTLQAEKKMLAAENSTLRRRVGAIEASLDRYVQHVERKSITPEMGALLEKSGYNVSELMASKKALSVSDVDNMLANSGITLDPTMRMALKNQLQQAGLMDTGQIQRYN